MNRHIAVYVWLALWVILSGNFPSSVKAEAQQRRIGKFTRVSSERLPPLIQPMGALDARRELYVTPDGVQVQYQFIVLPSANEANAYFQSEMSQGVKEGAILRYNNRLSDLSGRPIGEIVLLQKGDGEAAIWTTDQLLLMALGPQGYVWDFVQSLFGYPASPQPTPFVGSPGSGPPGSAPRGRSSIPADPGVGRKQELNRLIAERDYWQDQVVFYEGEVAYWESQVRSSPKSLLTGT